MKILFAAPPPDSWRAPNAPPVDVGGPGDGIKITLHGVAEVVAPLIQAVGQRGWSADVGVLLSRRRASSAQPLLGS